MPTSNPESTKVLRFPGPLRFFQIDNKWMEIHKIHGKRPDSTPTVAIWGDWSRDEHGNEDGTSWSSLIAFSEHEAANAYAHRLNSLLEKGQAQTLQKLESHWRQGCYYVYRLGLNDARLRLLQTVEAIENIVSNRLLLSCSVYRAKSTSGTKVHQIQKWVAPMRV